MDGLPMIEQSQPKAKKVTKFTFNIHDTSKY